jgi:hypothetical protein
VKKIASDVVSKTQTVAPAFRNFVEAVLPQLYSTSSQGIVVAGHVAGDIRILNNTVQGTVQGIHVALCDMRTSPTQTNLQVHQVQICGNTIAIRLTPQFYFDRHGVYLGGVTSGLISDNSVELTRTQDASQEIWAIRVLGHLGSRVLVERNYMNGFGMGLVIQPNSASNSTGTLWKTADNWSSTKNLIPPTFVEVNNVPN